MRRWLSPFDIDPDIRDAFTDIRGDALAGATAFQQRTVRYHLSVTHRKERKVEVLVGEQHSSTLGEDEGKHFALILRVRVRHSLLAHLELRGELGHVADIGIAPGFEIGTQEGRGHQDQ